jgi:hypothetical protein
MIGLGGAGTAIVKHTHQTIQKEMERSEDDSVEDLNKYFRFYVLDSSNDEFSELDDDIGRNVIQDEETLFRENRSKYPFLSEDFEYSAEGARRCRSIARYKLDNKPTPGFEEHYDIINKIIETHMSDVEDLRTEIPNRMNIFIAHSLAGGTGSGTFPLVAAMANEKAKEMNYDTYLSGIGVISKVKDPILVEEPGFRPNMYASMRDVMKMSSDKRVLPIYSKKGPGQSSNIGERLEDGGEATDFHLDDPVDHYWFVGINEGLKERGKESGQSESYVEEIDNTIAESVLSLSRLKGEKENFVEERGVCGSLGEAEITVPMDIIERYCETQEDVREMSSDLFGGDIPEGYRELEPSGEDKVDVENFYSEARGKQKEHIDDDIEEIFDRVAEENFGGDKTIFSEDIESELDKLGSEIRDIFDPEDTVEEEIDEIYNNLDTCEVARLKIKAVFKKRILDEYRDEVYKQFNETVDELCRKERYDIRTKGVSREQRRYSLRREIKEQIEENEASLESLNFSNVEKLIEAGKMVAGGSYVYPPKKSKIRSKLREAEEDLSDLNSVCRHKDNFEKMEEYISERHTEAKRGLKKLVDEFYSMKTDMDRDKQTLVESNYSTRLGYLPVNEDIIEGSLDKEWLEDNISDIRDCFDEDLVNREDFNDALKKQVKITYPWEESVTRKGEENKIQGEYRGDEEQTLWIFYHESNEQVVEDHFDDDSYVELTETARSGGDKLAYSGDPYRIKMVAMFNSPHVDLLDTYQILDDLKEENDLGSFTNPDDSPYDDWRQAHAYAEWYDDEIRRSFGVEKTVTLYRPPPLDMSHIDVSDVDLDQVTYIIKYGLEEYLWNGKLWERYENVDENWFRGWGKTLQEETDISKGDLGDLKNNNYIKQWDRGARDWKEILNMTKENMIRDKKVDIRWEIPEEQKRDWE